MIDLKGFRRANNLTQDKLGEYLGIKKSFISKIEHGGALLPQDKFKKLLNNDKGWNISSLKAGENDNNIVGNPNNINDSVVITKILKELADTRKQVDNLIEIVKQQMEIIKNK